MKKITFYPLIVMVGLFAILIIIRWPVFKPTQPDRQEKYGNCVQLNYKVFEEAIKDTCDLRLSKDKLKCSPDLLQKILVDVDSLTFEKVSESSLTFKRERDYIEVPAAMLANMVDLNLFRKTITE